MEQFTLKNVSYVYGQGTPFEKKALEDVNITLKTDRITGIIGHTGSGKSTMMQLLNGLSEPTIGKVFMDGYDINCNFKDLYEDLKNSEKYKDLSKKATKKTIKEEYTRRRRELCFRVGLVMQYPEYQLFEETVYKDIAFGPSNMGLSPEEIDARVREASFFTGVDSAWFEKSPFDLSGGQKRRVAVAGVMAMRPEVLVLDEPAAGLDPSGRRKILESIRNYHKTTGAGVIIVSHSMEDMAEFCDEIVVLAKSKVILQGTREEIFSHAELLEQNGLGVPQVTSLIRTLRQKGWSLPENIYTVEQAKNAILEMCKKAEGREKV